MRDRRVGAFETEKVREILESLVAQNVMVKNREKYHVSKEFDFLFRAHMIVEFIKKKIRTKDGIITKAIVSTLDDFGVSLSESLDSSLIVRTILTFVSDEKLQLVENLLAAGT